MEPVNIIVTESALSDLEDIETYIAQDSTLIARRFISRIFDKIDVLYNYPKAGKPVPELNNPIIRELLLNKYRIIYQLVSETQINIIRVVHGSRLLDIEL
ncbi:type II toxin-antitoxin system RelE/ParE family toxin [Mucilaginibacter terrigena]|uniref:Type II toxin-antitoxin system RelE/ParE family toxin n=1 Tax=Mucilaginibacter terrigena TaxID=2492395 RepID=A0A4V1ZBV1_9SPHI|nr:type II toxin-antitoxin system RelE/ParE family toxin [Mucilaginibacter terrigena]RYU90440.1 type II toxin-antitoxin system RelE/ParE family toxin [Mucilaginibacter terrigena]